MDKGCAKPSPDNINTEAAWQRRRRGSVDAAVQPRRLSFGDGEEAHGHVDGWTPKHEKLLKKQEAKARKRKVEALMDGVLLGPEVTPQARHI
jgi:hypothetical protein